MTPYLERRAARLAVRALKREIIFGFVVSTIMLVVGLWRYFIVIGASGFAALGLAAAGVVGLLLTLAFPSAWHWPEHWLGTAVRTVGAFLFMILLALVYALLVSPVGWLQRKLRGVDPVYSWVGAPPADMEGWHPKEVYFEANLSSKGSPSTAWRFVTVLQFFASRGHYLFIPTLVLLIALGMVLFFVKSSALAPFIYTLF